jgi:anti-sigma regulatory factor (Ser/Thr protein kinase)
MPETVRLAHGVRAPAYARRWMAEQCTSWGCDDLAETASLILSELVTNVFLHAGTECTIEADYADSELTVIVSDGLAAEVRPQDAGVNAEQGRGLAIVANLADMWGVAYEQDDKSVWFTVTAASAADGRPA